MIQFPKWALNPKAVSYTHLSVISQHFTSVARWTSTTAESGVAKFHMKHWSMSMTKVSVFCIISKCKVFGPFFYGEKHKWYCVSGYARKFPHSTVRERRPRSPASLPTRHDTASFSLHVRAFLDNQFSGHWIGCAGPIAWSPHSPQLTLSLIHI